MCNSTISQDQQQRKQQYTTDLQQLSSPSFRKKNVPNERAVPNAKMTVKVTRRKQRRLGVVEFLIKHIFQNILEPAVISDHSYCGR